MLPQLFEGGVFDDGFVEGHGGGLVHAEARRRGGGEIVDDAVETFFECRGSEIDEQFDGEVHQKKRVLTRRRGDAEVFSGVEITNINRNRFRGDFF